MLSNIIKLREIPKYIKIHQYIIIMNKICTLCEQEKELLDFPIENKVKQTYKSRCKNCIAKLNKEYREKNKELLYNKKRDYVNKNKEIIKYRDRQRYKKEKIIRKRYNDDNKDKINNRAREKYKNDPNFRMKKILRSRFKKTVTGKKKYKSVISYLGISVEIFKKWIESQFDNKMSWDNQGIHWHIDHVIPCSSFDLTDEKQIKKCFYWKNMCPLSRTDNLEKSNKIDENLIKKHYSLADEYEKKCLKQ